MNKLELMKMANEVRKGAIVGVYNAKSGHPGGSLSAAELFTYLIFEELNIDPKNPQKADRDRFVLSKGHTAPGYYAALANRGFFPVEDLATLRKVGSYLQGHPDMKGIPGVDMSSGSLGQGISAAVGMAISAKIYNDDYRVYTLLGDGEIQEGQVWEAAMLAGHRKLDNLVVVVDNNGLQIDGNIAGYASLSSYRKKQAYASCAELSVYVNRMYRNQKVASHLMDNILDYAYKHEFHTIVSVITSGNSISEHLHKKYHFEYCGTIKEVGYKMNQYLSIDNYQLILNE